MTHVSIMKASTVAHNIKKCLVVCVVHSSSPTLLKREEKRKIQELAPLEGQKMSDESKSLPQIRCFLCPLTELERPEKQRIQIEKEGKEKTNKKKRVKMKEPVK